jgi:uncharacterized Zn-finger protein
MCSLGKIIGNRLQWLKIWIGLISKQLLHVPAVLQMPKTFKCLACEKMYTNISRLKLHARITHGQVRRQRFPCEYCFTTFVSKYNKNVHMNARKYKCDVCEEDFSFKWRLLQHNSGKHDIGIKFACKICGRKFSRNDNAKRHQEECSGSNQRKTCTVCHKTLKNTAYLFENSEIPLLFHRENSIIHRKA